MHYINNRKTSDPGFINLFPLFFICLCLSTLNVNLCLGAQDEGVSDFGIPYKMKITGISDRKLLVELKAVSDTISLKSRLPASVNLLRRRVERDRISFLKMLKAHGYYGAQVETDMDLEIQPVQIIFKIDAGPCYLLSSVEFQVTGEVPTPYVTFPDAQQMGLVINGPLRAREILDAQKTLLLFIRRQGFPFPKIMDRRIILSHSDHSGLVKFRIDTGLPAGFGKTVIVGLKTVDEIFVRKMIPWEEGNRYDPQLIEQLQTRMTNSGLFSMVRIRTGEPPDETGRVAIEVEVSERKHRTASAGINYKTDEGPGAKISWEHRNFLNQGERLTLAASLSEFTRDFESGFREPYFFRPDQALQVLFRIADDSPDAYSSRNIKSTAVIERELDKEKTIGAGLGFKASKVEQIGKEEDYRLIFLPSYFRWDASNDLLDPTRGGRLFLQFIPFYDIMGSDANFIKAYGSYSHYVPVSKKPMLGLAGKLSLGTIQGTGFKSIPADERFYAGGGGSIRGYAYQYVGPLEDGEPIGGRSLVELTTELRAKLTNHFGLVAFLDGGSAFPDTIPDSSQDIRWGTGIGLRYFTPIGPLRFDAAIPLNRRAGIDDNFQLYISLGQAF